MEFYDAVYHVAWLKGKAVYEIGLGLGHTSSYIAGQKSRMSSPRVDTAVRILEFCGYKLCAVPEDNVPEDAIVIDNQEESQ